MASTPGTVPAPPTQQTSILSSLKELAALSTIGLAYAFLAGYVYLTTYFGAFRIELWLLDVPVYNFAPHVIVEFTPGVLLMVSFVAAYFWSKFEIHWKPRFSITERKEPWPVKVLVALRCLSASF
jgi:hypothetical protein